MALEGKPDFLKKAIEVLDKNLKEVDDKFLIGCHINNIACSRWWLNISSILLDISNAKVMDSNNIDLFKKLALESVEIIKMFKKAILSLEGIDFSIENDYDYSEEKKKILSESELKEHHKNDNYDSSIIYYLLLRSRFRNR